MGSALCDAIFKAADESIFAQAWGRLSEFFQWAPQRADERRRERRKRKAMAAEDLVRRYPAYVEPTVRETLTSGPGRAGKALKHGASTLDTRDP